MAEESKEPAQEAEGGTEERRRLRPFRRLVGVLFAVAVVVGAFVILRGIIRHLDRMPSAEDQEKPKIVDVRALRACAEDLERLEVRVRQTAAAAFSVIPAEHEALPDWEALSKQFVLDRVAIEARCRLREKSNDPAAGDLRTAADEIDELVRTYQVLYDRHLEAVLPHAQNAQAALKRAGAALSAR